MKKYMLAFRIVLTALLCAAVLAGLSACAGDDPAGTALDRMLWDMRGFPSQEEILDQLQEKYDEDFVLLDLNSGNRFFQGVAYPSNNPDLVFSLEMNGEDGNPLPVQYMRDDYQARLAEQYILQHIRPLIEREFGAGKVENVRVEIGLFDRVGEFTLPESFEWSPADGLEVLAEKESVTVQLMIRIMLEDGTVSTAQRAQNLIAEMIDSAGIPFGGSLNVIEVNSDIHYLIEWSMTGGELGDISVDIIGHD